MHNNYYWDLGRNDPYHVSLWQSMEPVDDCFQGHDTITTPPLRFSAVVGEL